MGLEQQIQQSCTSACGKKLNLYISYICTDGLRSRSILAINVLDTITWRLVTDVHEEATAHGSRVSPVEHL